MNTEVGSLSLLQQIFPTQESNQDLLHCRQIFYQLNCPGWVGGAFKIIFRLFISNIYDLRDYIHVQGLGLEGDLLESHLECVASFCPVCI